VKTVISQTFILTGNHFKMTFMNKVLQRFW